MGFDLTQIISDDKHYGAFICHLCEGLVSLDAVITTKCSHPFCRDCMTEWASNQIHNRMGCTCPKCDSDLTAQNGSSSSVPSSSVLYLGDTAIMVQPLVVAQPLAFEVLKMIQVACIGSDSSRECEWTGDYGDWQKHRDAHDENGTMAMQKAHDSASSLTMTALFVGGGNQTRKPTTTHVTTSTTTAQPTNLEIEGPFTNAPSLARKTNLEFVPEHQPAAGGNIVEVPEHRPSTDFISPRMKLQRGMSTTKMTKDAQQRTAIKNFQRQYKSASDLGQSMEEAFGYSTAAEGGGNREHLVNGQHHRNDIPESHELEHSYTEGDWNTSFRSLQQANSTANLESPKKNKVAFSAVDEEKSQAFTLDMEEDERSGAEELETSAQAVERSEKLKKQANAKFNKGDFEGARSLYTDGLNVMTSIITVSKEECELVATLFSNRAVTYFREKDFKKCIEDCGKALDYEPTFEKSYIRKWRALMALGKFEEACDCLEQAHREIPSSARVRQELVKAREQRDVLSAVNTMIDGGNLEKAKETINPLTKESDNIGLLLVAAMADAGLGLTESALDKVNKALRFNPNHVDALQLRGLVLFLSGEMEKGARLLQELQSRHPDVPEVQMKMEQCQNTLSAFSRGRAYSKRGRYKEAVEQFSLTMEEDALPLPSGTALYCLIKIERAEALLLSKYYAEALRDCKDALESQPENAEAWALKAEVYMCLGRAAEAKEELAEIRQTWGSDNLIIDDAYRKANFEVKVRKVDDELMQLINDVEAGVPEKVIIDGRDSSRESRSSGMHQSEKRYGSSDRRSHMEKRAKSYRSLKSSERDRKSERNRKERHADRKSRRDRDRARSTTGEGSIRTIGTQASNRTLNTTATGISSRTINTRGTNGASHRAKRMTRKKSTRVLKTEKP